MRKFVWLTGMFLLVATCAMAQDTPQAEIFGGYSYVRFNPGTGFSGVNEHGGSGSVAYNVNSNFGIVGDFGFYKVGDITGTFGSGTTAFTGTVPVNGKVVSYLFGPRLSYRAYDKVTPFAQVLFGGARRGDITTSAVVAGFPAGSKVVGSQNAFAVAFGGGLDAKVHPNIAIRLAQVEFLLTRFQDTTSPSSAPKNGTQKNVRISAGIVFRLGSRK